VHSPPNPGERIGARHQNPASGPLQGTRVLDLSRLVCGNMLTMLLGDFGADVVKVEQPGSGDTLRYWTVDGQDVYWQVYGRNKRSVTVDLRDPLGRELLLRMVADADVLVESFRPGGLEGFGLAPDVLRERGPRLVVVRISGWGLTGAFAQRPGFGTLVEAMSGFAAMNGFADREPVLPPHALSDMTAGIYGAFATSMAVHHAYVTGAGQDVDLSLFDSLFSTLGPMAAAYDTSGHVQQRAGSSTPYSAPRNVYRTADGKWLALSAPTQAMAVRFFRAIGMQDTLEDPRFKDNASRVNHMAELDALLGDYFATVELSDCLSRLDEAGVTAAPISSIDELVDSEFFRTRQVVVPGPANAEGAVAQMHNVVPRLSTTPGGIRLPAPRLGEHNEEILRPSTTQAEWDRFTASIGPTQPRTGLAADRPC